MDSDYIDFMMAPNNKRGQVIIQKQHGVSFYNLVALDYQWF